SRWFAKRTPHTSPDEYSAAYAVAVSAGIDTGRHRVPASSLRSNSAAHGSDVHDRKPSSHAVSRDPNVIETGWNAPAAAATVVVVGTGVDGGDDKVDAADDQ